MALAALRRSGRVFCHFCASRRVFHDETGVMGSGEAEYGDEMPSSAPACDQGHLPSWMMTSATWLRYAICQASPKTHSKVSFCSPFHPVIFQRKSRCLGHTKRGGVRHRCPDGRESTETIWNPARGRGRGAVPSPWAVPPSVFPGAVHRGLFEHWTSPVLVRLFPGEASRESLRNRLGVAREQAKGVRTPDPGPGLATPHGRLGSVTFLPRVTLVPLLRTTGV